MPNVPVRGADGGTYQLEYVLGPGGGLVPGTPVDGDELGHGGTDTTGSSQTLATANSSRKRIDVSNTHDSIDVFLAFGTGATAESGEGQILPPNSTGSYYTTAAVKVIGTAGARVTYTEW